MQENIIFNHSSPHLSFIALKNIPIRIEEVLDSPHCYLIIWVLVAASRKPKKSFWHPLKGLPICKASDSGLGVNKYSILSCRLRKMNVNRQNMHVGSVKNINPGLTLL